MKDPDWFSVMAGFVVLGVLVIAAVAIVEEAPAARPASVGSAAGSPDFLYLTISFNPVTGFDEYFPANFSVPAHTLVVITITNFDNGSNPVPASLRAVSGTVGNTESVTEGNPSTTDTIAGLPPGGLAHTFSIAQIGLNAPIPSAPSSASPSVTSFDVYFNATGALLWMCQAPCDPVSMMMPGFMSGTVTVD